METEPNGQEDKDFVAPRTGEVVPVETSAETETQPSIEALPELLGFVETAEMRELRPQFIEAIQSGTDEVRIGLARRYTELANQVVGQYQGDALDRAEIGRIVAMATMRRDAGRSDYYLEELEEALERASQEGYSDASSVIEAAIGAANVQ